MARDDDTASRFRTELRAERKHRHWSQAEMVERLKDHGIDLPATAIAKIETGVREVSVGEASAIADLFGCSIDQLAGRRARPASDRDFVLRRLVDAAQQAVDGAATYETLRQRCAELAAVDRDGKYADLIAKMQQAADTLALVIDQLRDTGYVTARRPERGHHA
jgi:transcriptional regulator with XRE-family HTH domain